MVKGCLSLIAFHGKPVVELRSACHMGSHSLPAAWHGYILRQKRNYKGCKVMTFDNSLVTVSVRESVQREPRNMLLLF